MANIRLNTTKLSSVDRILVKSHGKKKRKPNKDGFSFSFTNTAPIKAVVAKIRKPELLAKKNALSRKTVSSKLPPPKSAQKFDFDVNTVPDADNIQLSLNICSGSAEERSEQTLKTKIRDLPKSQQKLLLKKKRMAKETVTAPILSSIVRKPVRLDLENRTTNTNVQKPKRMKSLFTHNPEVKTIGQRLVKPIHETVFTGQPTDSIDLHPHSVKNLSDVLKIVELTTVQQRTIPAALQGNDILVRSQTGSGKTVAYAIPLIEKLIAERPKLTRTSGIKALIIVPTREIAIQTYELFVKLLKPFTWIVSTYLSGGEKRKSEKARLRKGINILIGTPGRLCDHLLHTSTFKLDQMHTMILDEADRLFELSYEIDVKRIIDFIPKSDTEVKKIQTILLSATLSPSVKELAGLTLKNPLYIDTSDANDADLLKVMTSKIVIPDTVTQHYVLVPPKLRLVILSGLLAHELRKPAKIVIFFGTESLVDYHYDLMVEALTIGLRDDDEREDEDSIDGGEMKPLLGGARFYKLHGSLTQVERSSVFNSFRDTKSGILLSTDVAARGIHFPSVDLVIQYSPPQVIADYVHRVGRTGRAGSFGRSILFLAPNESDFVRTLEDNVIRIGQDDTKKYLEALKQENSMGTVEEIASELQRRFEAVIDQDKEMYESACKAFVSWIRFVSAFPREQKLIFNIKTAHMGHYAKSLGLRESPKAFTKEHSAPAPPLPTNRLTYRERATTGSKINQNAGNKRPPAGRSNMNLKKMLMKSISLTTSEFSSGLPSLKKRKK